MQVTLKNTGIRFPNCTPQKSYRFLSELLLFVADLSPLFVFYSLLLSLKFLEFFLSNPLSLCLQECCMVWGVDATSLSQYTHQSDSVSEKYGPNRTKLHESKHSTINIF